MTPEEHAYFARGGVIKKLPTGFSAPCRQANPLPEHHQKAIRKYTEEQELKRKGKLPLRMELRHDAECRTENFQVEGERISKVGGSGEVSTPEQTPCTEEEKPAPAKDKQMTRNKLFISAQEEVTIYRYKNGTSEIKTVDHQGREYLSRFGKNNNFQGTKWLNADLFKKVDLR